MFGHEEFQTRLREKPFVPFRIIASEGLSYEIRHPDLVFLGRRDMQIGFAAPDAPSVYDRVIRVAYVHVVALEDLPAPASPGTNGST